MTTSPDTDKQRKRVYSALTELLIGSITRREAIDRIFDILASQPPKEDTDELTDAQKAEIDEAVHIAVDKYGETFKKLGDTDELTFMLYELAQLVGETSAMYKNLRRNIEYLVFKRSREAEIAGALAAREALNHECGIESNATPEYLIDRYAELTKKREEEV